MVLLVEVMRSHMKVMETNLRSRGKYLFLPEHKIHPPSRFTLISTSLNLTVITEDKRIAFRQSFITSGADEPGGNYH